MVSSKTKVTCVLAAMVAVLASCGSPSTLRDPIPNPVPAYVPFVESLKFPPVVEAGTTFSVTISLSASLKPEILSDHLGQVGNGAPAELVIPSSETGGASAFEGDVLVYPFFPLLEDYGPGRQEFEVTLPGLTAGEHKLVLLSAQSESTGGILIENYASLSGLPPGTTYRIFSFTVLP